VAEAAVMASRSQLPDLAILFLLCQAELTHMCQWGSGRVYSSAVFKRFYLARITSNRLSCQCGVFDVLFYTCCVQSQNAHADPRTLNIC